MVQNKTDHKSEVVTFGEALKAELRVLVEQLQMKFLEVENTVRTLTAAAAVAATTVPSREDPWFRPGQPAPQAAAAEPWLQLLHASGQGSSG